MEINLSWTDVQNRARRVVEQICLTDNLSNFESGLDTFRKIYPVPRGGIPAAQSIQTEFSAQFPEMNVDGSFQSGCFEIAETPEEANVIVDDIIDSGETRTQFHRKFPNKPFFAVVDKTHLDKDWQDDWVVFPWERMNNEQGPEENIRRVLEYIGEDPKREGLLETPKRVIKSFRELYGGYSIDPSTVFTTFDDESTDEMVLLRDIEFHSMCEHHMLPFHGTASIAYIPNGKIVGISKLARLLDVFAKRLQIQERICQQVTDTLDLELGSLGSACVLKAKHMCMCARGVNKQNSVMVTSSLSGAFRKPEARAEFMALIS